MKSLPLSARVYILMFIALSLGAVLFSAFQIGTDWTLWFATVVIAIGIAILDVTPVRLFGEKIEITLSGSIVFASILLYPPAVVVVSSFAGATLGELRASRPWYKKMFNSGQMTIGYFIAALAFQIVHQPLIDYFGSLRNVLSILLSGFIGIISGWIFISFVIHLVAHTPLLYVLKQNMRQVGWYELSIPVLGTVLAILWQYNPLSILLGGIFFVILRESYQVAVQLQKQTHDALRALMQVIDVRDHHTYDHSERVSKYTQLMGEKLGLPQEEIEVLAEAGLLHDLGKVGMVDDVLYKNGILNPDERKHAQKHAEVGSMLLAKFPLFQKGALLVRHHHERYDGNGYPDGLAGDQIPIGSRIISVADAYQAMTENRPYRPALTQAQAIEQLLAGSGTQFDPQVVDVFMRVLKSNSR